MLVWLMTRMPALYSFEQPLPVELGLALLKEAAARDPVTARRMALLSILWQEGFLTAIGLMARAEALVGRGCFGQASVATFRRDMRALKYVLAEAGHTLRFSRRVGQGGYYVAGRPALAPELAASIHASVADVDAHQIELAGQLTPADRVRQAGLLSDGLRNMAVRRLLAERPSLTPQAAQWEVLHRYHQLGG